MALDVVKVTLSSGKVVILKKMLIKHQEQAALLVGDRANDNGVVFSMLMQKELLKLLLHSVNGVELKDADKQVLDDHFDIEEYYQISGVIGKLTGNDNKGKPILEVVKSGE
jgi:hypothetical protein